MSNVEVFDDNFLDSSIVSTTKSSEQTSFPASNILDFQRRSKVWRTNGYWVITSSNKGIVFQASAGVNLTANIAEGTYTSISSLLAAIKTALQAADGAHTYTVTQDLTTLKIKIATSHTFLSLMCTNVAFTAASILGFSTSADRTGATSYIADTLKIATGEWIRWDLGTAQMPKSFILIGDRARDIQISSTATITLEANTTDAWTSPAYSQTITWNRHIMSVLSSTGLTYPTGYRYWRLKIDDQSNINGYVEIAKVYLGSMWTPSQGSVQFPFTNRGVDYSDIGYSELGHPLVTRRKKTQILTVSWWGLSNQDCEDLFDMWETFGKTDPFFINLDPDAVFTVDTSRNFKFVRFDNEPDFRLESPNVWSCTMQLREEL